jgi:alpha-1,6-mannosyltransferase
MFFVALVSATPRSPFFAVLPREMEPTGPLRWISDLVGIYRLSETGLMILGLVTTAAAGAAFLLLVREAWHERVSMKTIVILTIAYHAVVITLPLLFSRDVYSYAYYGRIVETYGANPYVLAPRDFPLNSLWKLTWPGWRGTPSVYGPLFTWLSAALASIVKSVPSLITGFQLLAAAASLGTVAIVARLVRRVRPERALFAVALIGVNPIVVFHVVGGGHNDMLVGLFVAAAAALLFARRHLLSAVALAFGMSVKASAVIPLILLVVAVAAGAPEDKRRGVLFRYLGAVAGVWLLLALPFLQSENPTLGVAEASGHDSWMAPGQIVVRLSSGIAGAIAGDGLRDLGASVARLSLFGFSALGVAMIARYIWRNPAAREPAALATAWGWALMVVILPSPVLFTWYFMWILPLAWLLPRVPRRAIVILASSFIVTQLVTEASRLPDPLQTLDLPFGHPIAIAVCLWFLRDFLRRIRSDTPLDAETGERIFGDRFEAGGLPTTA